MALKRRCSAAIWAHKVIPPAGSAHVFARLAKKDPPPGSLGEALALGGLVGFRQWLIEHPDDRRNACTVAAQRGHLEALQWAQTHDCFWDETTCTYAAGGGHLKTLQWARANGCAWDEIACSLAAKGGHLEVLKWARANGCPWDAQTCALAAKGGHLETLQWARANFAAPP